VLSKGVPRDIPVMRCPGKIICKVYMPVVLGVYVVYPEATASSLKGPLVSVFPSGVFISIVMSSHLEPEPVDASGVTLSIQKFTDTVCHTTMGFGFSERKQ